MSIFTTIRSYLQGNASKEEGAEGYCPNCWGKQEYGGKLYDAVEHERIDLNNIDLKKGWIEAYAARNLQQIQLQKNNAIYVCSTCNMEYDNA